MEWSESEQQSTMVQYTEADEQTTMASHTEKAEQTVDAAAEEVSPKESDAPSREEHFHDGNLTVGNDLRVGGTLRAHEIVHPFGGRFLSYEELLKEYPSPHVGWWAWTGIGFPGQIWFCEDEGIWSKGAGLGDEVRVEVESDGGNYMLKGQKTKKLTAHVYVGEQEVTEIFPPTNFSWKRRSRDAESDEYWNRQHIGAGKEIEVRESEIERSAVFVCDVRIDKKFNE